MATIERTRITLLFNNPPLWNNFDNLIGTKIVKKKKEKNKYFRIQTQSYRSNNYSKYANVGLFFRIAFRNGCIVSDEFLIKATAIRETGRGGWQRENEWPTSGGKETKPAISQSGNPSR